MKDDLLNDFLLKAFPNPERKGCPDEKTIRALAESRLAAGHPVLQHVASCSECYAEYRHYYLDRKEFSGKTWNGTDPTQMSAPAVYVRRGSVMKALPFRVLPWMIAALVVLVVGSSFVLTRHHFVSTESALRASNSRPPTDASVDLFNAITARGGGDNSAPLQEVSLPSAVIHLSVILPRFSESGSYEILVSRDRAAKDVVARGLGNTVDVEGRLSLIVTLDLRNTARGMYFLATVRGSDKGTYYYPLKIK